MHPDRRSSDDTVIRTGTERMTIVEAHPYHHPLSHTDHRGAGTYIKAYSAVCPLSARGTTFFHRMKK